jgi:hypothetical protein
VVSANADLPLPGTVSTFLKQAREDATRLSSLTSTIAAHPGLRLVLSVALTRPLAERALAPSPLVLARMTSETLRVACDELYRPGGLVEQPEALLQRSFPLGEPSPYPPVRLWVAARLRWFAGATVDVTAAHLQLSPDVVKRLLAEAGPAIDELWLARYAPDLR